MFQNFKHQKRKNTLNSFSLFTTEAKGSNKFCKVGYFPHRIFDIFLFEIKDFTVQILER